ncbi:MAG: hypothetical protein NZV14_01175 [Bryobacteraceae bacterium]|nr:hypothetical protein [Bryobacteraceae bacterium]MDW8376742.1 hypothetical protein [Bryobacterales bacterium]
MSYAVEMQDVERSRWREILLPSVAMMLGWGLRGFIGGGPFGAMIPGAMVALCLCLVHQRSGVARTAAFGALGVGIGGEMTYGQTVGFIVRPETFFWGLTGLTLKGAVWGALGGAILALSFVPRLTLTLVASSGMVMAVACYAGWKWINEPKLIYFSNRFDHPRTEIWAGFLLASVALLVWLRWQGAGQIPLQFALSGAVGGGIGFGAGGAIQGLGRIFLPSVQTDWWKYMEFTFGFCFGLALAFAARRLPLETASEPEQPGPSCLLQVLGAAALTAFAFWWEATVAVRFSYLLLACLLLCVAYWSRWAAWHIAITVTVTAFALDSAKYFSVRFGGGQPSITAYGVAVAGSFIFAALFTRGTKSAQMAFLWLLWSAVGVASLKHAMHPKGVSEVFSQVNVLFLLMAVACTAMTRLR